MADSSQQFRVTCAGDAEYPEDDPIYGTYWVPATIQVGGCSSIAEAIRLAEIRLTQGDWRRGKAYEALGFTPRLFTVRDSARRLAVAGEVWDAEIRWCSPVSSNSEAAEVAAEANRLREKAAFEAGWDNFSTARQLRFEADLLEARLVDPIWRDAARAALPDVV